MPAPETAVATGFTRVVAPSARGCGATSDPSDRERRLAADSGGSEASAGVHEATDHLQPVPRSG